MGSVATGVPVVGEGNQGVGCAVVRTPWDSTEQLGSMEQSAVGNQKSFVWYDRDFVLSKVPGPRPVWVSGADGGMN